MYSLTINEMESKISSRGLKRDDQTMRDPNRNTNTESFQSTLTKKSTGGFIHLKT